MPRVAIAAMACALAASCVPEPAPTPDPIESEPPPWSAPDETGPYAVGVTTRTVVDDRGKTLKMEIWYPAIDPGTDPDPYEELPFARDAHREAEPNPIGAPYPLVAFSHGYGGIRYQSTYLTEHLAAHGFVVVGVDHPRNTLYDLDESATLEVLAERPGDVRRAVDAVDGFVADDPLLAGLADSSTYAMAGHSFGAFTTLILAGGALDLEHGAAFCKENHVAGCDFFAELGTVDTSDAVPDPRVVAAAPVSLGGWYAFGPDGEGLSDLTPVLAMSGDRDEDLPYSTEGLPTMEALSPATRITLHDTGHWAVTDLCLFVTTLVDCAGPEDGWQDPAIVQDRVKTWTTAWLRVEMLGDDRDRPWLDEERWRDDDALTVSD